MYAIDHTMNKLVALTEGFPVGINLALFQFLWMLVSGAVLPQRGAIFPALQSIGLSEQPTRRAWATFRGGVWQTAILPRLWPVMSKIFPNYDDYREKTNRDIPLVIVEPV